MATEIIGVFIPIIIVIVTALVIIMWIYYRSREKQMIIERGLDTEYIKALMTRRKYPYALLKTGIIIFFFGLGLGIGLLIEVYTDVKQWIPFLIFAGVGLGFILAFVVGRKFEEKDKVNNVE
ncbi:MAG: DUF6249 domain-containing protein [Bacteroidota bacterium]